MQKDQLDQDQLIKLAEADLYKEQGLNNEAYEIYENLLQQMQDDHPLQGKTLACLNELRTLEGVVAPSGSQQELTTSIPATEQSIFDSSVGLIEAGFYQEAINQLLPLIVVDFENANVLAKIGEAYMGMSQLDNAINYFEQAVADPRLKNMAMKMSVFDRLAYAYECIGALPDAVRTLERMVMVDPRFRSAAKRLQAIKDIIRKQGRFCQLIKEKWLTTAQLTEAMESAAHQQGCVENILLTKYDIKENQLVRALAKYYRLPFEEYSLEKTLSPPRCIAGFNKQFFRFNGFVPIREEEGALVIAAHTPDEKIREVVTSALKITDCKFVVALKGDINKFIDSFYGRNSDLEEVRQCDNFFNNLEVVEDDDGELEDGPTESDSIVVQLVNKLIVDGVAQGASDIHIEARQKKEGVLIRFRIDGECQAYKSVPHVYKRSLVSRIKILAKLDISERRLPQDGKIKFTSNKGGDIELRVVTLPTVGGNEDVILRILAKNGALPLEDMGFQEETLAQAKKLLTKPHGLFLVVGPTGSGKTTALHAALRHVNRPNKKIWTVEDPVEILQPGLRQVQVDPKINLTFAKVLRSFLRADPDVIMIGETRDTETARIVVEASMTGHLVFSTLHTNSAAETVTRLLGMEVEPYNFADSLLGIMAQRLIRRLCPECRVAYHPSREEVGQLASEYGFHPLKPLEFNGQESVTLYHQGKGCPACKGFGFAGRRAIHELLSCNDAIRKLIVENGRVIQLKEAAVANGMFTLKQDGILKALSGVTSLKQIRAACA